VFLWPHFPTTSHCALTEQAVFSSIQSVALYQRKVLHVALPVALYSPRSVRCVIAPSCSRPAPPADTTPPVCCGHVYSSTLRYGVAIEFLFQPVRIFAATFVYVCLSVCLYHSFSASDTKDDTMQLAAEQKWHK
jgi:hypothetical protein